MTTNNHTLLNYTLSDFQEKIASTSPTPGGGSVAGITATFGLSLIVMAIEITRTKKNNEYDFVSELNQCKELISKLSSSAEKDIIVFENYMKALKLPKTNELEVKERRTALANAAIEATECPLNAASEILDSMRIGKVVLPKIKKEIVSDIGVGVSILFGSLEGMLLNVDINLPSIADDFLVMNMRNKRTQLLQGGETIFKETLDAVKMLLQS